MFAKGWCSQFIAKQTLMWVAAKIGVPQFPAIFLQRSNRQKGLTAGFRCAHDRRQQRGTNLPLARNF